MDPVGYSVSEVSGLGRMRQAAVAKAAWEPPERDLPAGASSRLAYLLGCRPISPFFHNSTAKLPFPGRAKAS